MKNTFNDVNEVFNEIEFREKTTPMYRVAVIFISPVTGNYSYRVAYFLDAMEASLKKEEFEEIYSKELYEGKYEIITDSILFNVKNT